MSESTKPAEPSEDPRIRFAGERTLLAWVRTGLALMGFGFVVARFGVFLRELTPSHLEAHHPFPGLTDWLGVGLVVFGVVVNLLAAWEHRAFLKRLAGGKVFKPPRWSLGIGVAIVLAACGAAMTVYLVGIRE